MNGKVINLIEKLNKLNKEESIISKKQNAHTSHDEVYSEENQIKLKQIFNNEKCKYRRAALEILINDSSRSFEILEENNIEDNEKIATLIGDYRDNLNIKTSEGDEKCYQSYLYNLIKIHTAKLKIFKQINFIISYITNDEIVYIYDNCDDIRGILEFAKELNDEYKDLSKDIIKRMAVESAIKSKIYVLELVSSNFKQCLIYKGSDKDE